MRITRQNIMAEARNVALSPPFRHFALVSNAGGMLIVRRRPIMRQERIRRNIGALVRCDRPGGDR